MTLHSDIPNTFVQPTDRRDHTSRPAPIAASSYPRQTNTHSRRENSHHNNNNSIHTGRYRHHNKYARIGRDASLPEQHGSSQPQQYMGHPRHTRSYTDARARDKTRVLTVFLPHIPLFSALDTASLVRSEKDDTATQLFTSWSELPANPLHGLPAADSHSNNTHKHQHTSNLAMSHNAVPDHARAAKQQQQQQPRPPHPSAQPSASDNDGSSKQASPPAAAVVVASTGPIPPSSSLPIAVFCCDVCQKEFPDAATLEAHGATHMRCHVAGCHFTCRSDKAWKMEEHVQLLHSRPNAPDLLDTSAYLAQRRRRYPTQEQVSRLAEELFYKAARGVPLSSERRRWLRQHGISVNKRARERNEWEEGGDGSGHTNGGAAVDDEGDTTSMQEVQKDAPSDSGHAQQHEDGPHQLTNDTSSEQQKSGSHDTNSAAKCKIETHERDVRTAAEQNHRHEEGDCTMAVVTEQHRAHTDSPVHTCRQCQSGSVSSTCVNEIKCSNDTDGSDDEKSEEDDNAPPTEQCARSSSRSNAAQQDSSTHDSQRSGTGDTISVDGVSARERTRVMAPVAAAKLLAKARGGRGVAGGGGVASSRRQQGGQGKAARVERTPSLYERLTEEDRLSERGVLLQAIRFFVSRFCTNIVMIEDTPEFVRRLSEELIQEQHECAICSEVLRRQQRLWSCTACYEIFHLQCIAHWARSEKKSREEQLRSMSTSLVDARRDLFCCPLCRVTQHTESTQSFWCFCGKVLDPPVDMMLVPGSCGRPCGRIRGAQISPSRLADASNPHSSDDTSTNRGRFGTNNTRNYVMNRRVTHGKAGHTASHTQQVTSLCPHRCTLLCHPGPCPPCPHTRQQSCYCGARSKRVGCSSAEDGFECGAVCNKSRSCGAHRCTRLCHPGPCPNCTETLSVSCYCGASQRNEVNCAQRDAHFGCGQPCTRRRDCGLHLCGELCHDGACQPCLRTPARQRFCPCGKMALNVTQRQSCLDPVPSCGQRCDLPLPCGHGCPRVCHDDEECARCDESSDTNRHGDNEKCKSASSQDNSSNRKTSDDQNSTTNDSNTSKDADRVGLFGCGPCTEMHQMRCRCNAKLFTMPCFCRYLPPAQWERAARQTNLPLESLPSSSYPPLCTRVCRRQLSCGRHTCQEHCCIDLDHTCLRECNRQLSCGKHRCGQLCHKGRCPPCTHVSPERLYCRCRRTWVEPPVPCGTGAVVCRFPCVLPRPCGHVANHNCHDEGTACAPCTHLVEKLCGSHEQPMPYYMPCCRTDVSCGARCHKMLPCCKKLCELVCHVGPCTHRCTHDFPNFAELLKR